MATGHIQTSGSKMYDIFVEWYNETHNYPLPPKPLEVNKIIRISGNFKMLYTYLSNVLLRETGSIQEEAIVLNYFKEHFLGKLKEANKFRFNNIDVYNIYQWSQKILNDIANHEGKVQKEQQQKLELKVDAGKQQKLNIINQMLNGN